jgi:nicotinamide mononucleotide transporter
MSPPEAAAMLFGILSLGFAIQQSLFTWPLRIVQVILAAWALRSLGETSELFPQGLLFLIAIYGWWKWPRGGPQRMPLFVTTCSSFALGGWIGAAVLFGSFWGFALSRFGQGAIPFASAFTIGAGLAASLLMAHKKLESWIFLAAAHLVAGVTYFQNGQTLLGGFYAALFGLSILGFVEWLKSFRKVTLAPPV